MKGWLTAATVFVAVALGAAAITLLLALLVTPRVEDETAELPPEMLAEIKAARDPVLDPDNPVVVHVPVDYSEGTDAPWFPKGDPPILAELVAQGLLPPVAERTGPEPAVFLGVDGIGRYGGTWIRAANAPFDVRGIVGSMSGSNLVRWSPHGYPIVPHIAKAWTASDDRREWTFYLRKGTRWSDGHPFTVDDILYWWHIDILALDAEIPEFMQVRGESGEIVKIDDHTFKFVFPHPSGLLLEILANEDHYVSPRHYLEPFHPEFGDRDLIEQTMRARRIPTTRGLYASLKHWSNPEHPRLWPWIYRTHKSNPPQSFVRNPYYFAVDAEGNQLPYVDRITYEVITPKLIPNAATGGRLTFQARHMRFDDYTLLMAERNRGDYDVYHWFPGWRSAWTVFPNLNRHVPEGDTIAGMKHRLLNERDFRIALSVAIDREEIIEAEYHGIGEPAQLAPGRGSPFHHEASLKSHTTHDPELANRLLDGLGLDRRDSEGMRTFPDGSRMVWYINFSDFTGPGPVEFVTTHWAHVGIRAIPRERARPLFASEKAARVHDFSIWRGESEFYPLVQPRSFVPTYAESHHAQGFGIWYQLGGLYGRVADGEQGAVEPPPGHPLRRAMEVLDDALQAITVEDQVRIFNEALDINAEHRFTISISTPPPQPVVVKRGFRNVPRTAIIAGAFSMPAHAGLEAFFFEEPFDTPGAIAQIRQEILEVTPPPMVTLRGSEDWSASHLVAEIVRKLFIVLGGLTVVLIGVRHPYVGRRFLIMIPTLLVVSISVFVIVQAPPGDFIQTKMLQAEMTQDPALIDEVNQIREIFPVDDPIVLQYVRWLGLRWFVTFDRSDAGLLQGNLGRSMETRRPVNEMVGDRILMTLAISGGTIIFTWIVAIPIGIYSAVRQYSAADYILTIIGFIGMCVPGFLLALIFMYVGQRFFGTDMTGLFSPEFATQPDWNWPKFVDLLKHIWVPIAVLGVGGTAQMIRIMRGNLLDELRKPYAVTARAKGVRPFRLLIKYPVRLALNPFVSSIGSVFPQLVSGGAIVAIVLSLPTVGPLMLSALMTEDIYLAGSLLMVLSLLGVLGTLVSDLLLLWLDPRIRMEGGRR